MNRLMLGRTKIKWYSENNQLKDLNRIVGKPTEFEWIIFPGFTTLGILGDIQKDECEPEQFKGRIIFMSMFNDIWREGKCRELLK